MVSAHFRVAPENSGLSQGTTTHQSKWRGVTEVVSIAALLHDIGHVPYGHTLEDEFTGIYPKHDGLGGSRVYEMLFSEKSDLAAVFSESEERWIEKISNEDLRRLIYLILSWKESVDPPFGFQRLLTEKIDEVESGPLRERLDRLKSWHKELTDAALFHPFMSDVVGNTICADLLDYLPRDRQHLGMEPRLHARLQRYLTVRPGTLYPGEGMRLSTMVTRRQHGGQRRDVATAVLDIMRERYEMSERVFYHHKKAAAGAMLAKLIAVAGPRKPRDSSSIYPAPWDAQPSVADALPHIVHLSDSELIDYLGKLELGDAQQRVLQRRLFAALRYRRRDMYQTLLVVDTDLAQSSKHSVSYFAAELRDTDETGRAAGREKLEKELESAGGANAGDVVLYCPSPLMQVKLVDARLEINEGRVLPLRVQSESFAYAADLAVLQQYYQELWRTYLFVAPTVFRDAAKSKAIVDAFSVHFGIPPALAYRKVRTHDFSLIEGVTVSRAFSSVRAFLKDLPVTDLPPRISAALLAEAANDRVFLSTVSRNGDPSERLTALLDVAILDTLPGPSGRKLRKAETASVAEYVASLRMGQNPLPRAARNAGDSFQVLVDALFDVVVPPA
ncbi:MAG: HD domain-containing protein [Terracidiphilus sp.]